MGMFLYSAALEMISINPRIFVLAFRDMLNNSVEHKHTQSYIFPHTHRSINQVSVSVELYKPMVV